jgi:hypothetical protein
MKESEIRGASLKYVVFLGTSNNCGIEVTINGTKHAVPIDVANRDYQKIKALSDAGTITIAAAD